MTQKSENMHNHMHKYTRKRSSVKPLWASLFILVLFLSMMSTIASFYFEDNLKLMPCPMCIGQRISMMATAFLMFLIIMLCIKRLRHGLMHVFWRWVVGFLLLLCIVILAIGGYIAFNQVYLQSLPVGDAPDCGPGLNFLIQTGKPLSNILTAVFQGSGECAKVSWRFLSLSLASWSAIDFVFTFLCSIVGFICFLKD